MQKITVKRQTILLALLAEAGFSRTRCKQLIRFRMVTVREAPVMRVDQPLAPGEVVVIKSEKEVSAEQPCQGLAIIYEDPDLIVVDKPAGLLTIATAKEKYRTAYFRLTHCLQERSGGNDRVFIVHRLDQATSGLLVFARNQRVKGVLQSGWQEVEKKYLAVVEGVPEKKKDRITSYLCESKALRVYSVKAPPAGGEAGKYAVTDYELLKAAGGYALLEVSPVTGRKNQIRVHLADIGHPVAGDKKYGAGADPLGRLGLHAGYLSFTHPVMGRRMEFTSPMPAKFKALFAGG